MSRIFVTQNFKAVELKDLPHELERVFSDLMDHANAGPDIAARLRQNEPLPEGMRPRDLIFDFVGGELKVGIWTGKTVVYTSFGSFTGQLTDAQHGERGGGTLHAEATALAAGFLSTAGFAILQMLAGFKGTTASAADPTNDQFPTNGSWGFHRNTTTGDLFLSYNLAGAILKTQLL